MLKQDRFKKWHMLVIGLLLTGSLNTVCAETPVADWEARYNTYLTYLETLRTAENQIKQYELEFNNAEKLLASDFHWDNTHETISELLDTIDSISDFAAQPGGLEAHVAQFQDLEYYQESECFLPSGCTKEQMDALWQNKVTSSHAQKEAHDALMHGLALQQTQLEQEAHALAQLQSRSTSAEGHMEAIQYASQLASSQAHQLMQIRGLLIAEQTAATAIAQEIADRNAQQEAASLHLRAGEFKKSPERNWLGVMP